MVGSNLRSEINFGNWSVNKYGKETQDIEMGIQKRRQCPQPPFTSPRVHGGAKKKLPAAKVGIAQKYPVCFAQNKRVVNNFETHKTERSMKDPIQLPVHSNYEYPI